MSDQHLGVRLTSVAIAAATGGRVLRPGPAGPVNANSDTLRAGEWFIALRGDGFDDHRFLPEAAARGAAGVILEYEVPGYKGPAVKVDNTWQAMGQLGTAARRHFQGPVVAVTGSVGKTTTCGLIRLAISSKGPVHPPFGNVNHQPGLSLALLACPSNTAAQVLELGTAAPGMIGDLSKIVQPNVVVITNIGPAHLHTLKSLRGVTEEKCSLINSARPGDTVVLNCGDPRLQNRGVPRGVKRVTFGPGGDVELLEVIPFEEGFLLGRWRTPMGQVQARLHTPARFVLKNASAALAVAWVLGVNLQDAAAGLQRFEPTGSRMVPVSLAPGVLVYEDAYNANPLSMAAALRVLAESSGRRIAVLGDMAELGLKSESYHSELVELAQSLGVEHLVLVGPQMKRTPTTRATKVHDVVAAASVVRAMIAPGDVVLIKGSRVTKLHQLVGLLGQKGRPS